MGTETSKYHEEKKESSIPSVAASESGEAQTEETRGSGPAHADRPREGEGAGKRRLRGRTPRTLPEAAAAGTRVSRGT